MLEYRWDKFHLLHAPKRTKIAYTALLLYLLMGLGTIIAIETIKTGWTPQGVADYYLGNEEKFMFEKTPLQMLEVTHMHLFSIPVVFFIMAHAFLMTTLAEKPKLWVALLAFGSVFLSIGSPWAVRYCGPDWGWVKVFGDGLLCATLIFMVVYPIYEMWWKKPGHRSKKRK